MIFGQGYEEERLSLVEMDQSGELDAEMREMVRGEQKELVIKQLELEAAITTMLLPSDPNDDRYCSILIKHHTFLPRQQMKVDVLRL